MTAAVYTNVPGALRAMPRWLLWKPEERGGKVTKIPINPMVPDRPGKSDDPTTWGTFDQATRAAEMMPGIGGVGFVFNGDGIIGVDFDHVRDPATGEIEPAAWQEIASLNSYTEVSPSGTGVHVICRGKIPGGRRRQGLREIYETGRYFTVTGEHVHGTPTTINDAQDAITRLCEVWFPPAVDEQQADTTQRPARGPSTLDDDEIIRKAKEAGNGAKFSALWSGDTGGYPSQSEADAALCGLLAFWTKDEQQIDRIFRRSGLMRPKWGEKHGAETYGERTIRGVLGVVKEQYGSPRASSRRGREGPAGGPSRDNGARPKIVITDTRLRDISDQSLEHLVATNDPERLFVRARGLVRIGTDEKGIAVIDRLNEHSFRGILERTCDYVRLQPDKKGNNDKILWKEVPTAPSKDLVNDVLSLGAWPFPVVESVVQTPIIHLDGSIITAAGYDPKTLSYYAPPNGTTIPAVPDVPTDQDVKDAADLIWEPFIDFPFIDETSKTHIAAALLTIVLRPVIPGPVPAFIIDKPAPGTGASLIASILSVIGQGGDAAVIGAPRDDDAWSKKITATLRAGITLANVDNVEHKLFAPSLAAVLTATIWRDRILGLSEMITLPNRTVWVLNGNNVSLGGDLPRRVIWSRMDAVSERPWQRERVKPYKHPDVLVWTYENRGRILAAVLTLTRNWIHKGRPGPGDVPKLGGYEPWRDIIGGILAASGFPGFLGNLEDVYSEMDVDGSQWDAFISRWYEIWGEDPITAADIINRIKRENDSTDPQSASSLRMLDALPDDLADAINDRKGSPSKRVGNAIRKRKDRVFSGGLRLVKAGVKHSTIRWRIKPVEKQSVLQTPQTPPQDTEKGGLQKHPSDVKGGLGGLYLTDRREEKKDDLSHIGNGAGQTPQTTTHDENTQNTNPPFPAVRVEENFHHLIGKYDLHPDLDVSGHTRFKKAGSQCSCKGCGSPGEWHDYENKIRPAPLCDRHYRELKAACEREQP